MLLKMYFCGTFTVLFLFLLGENFGNTSQGDDTMKEFEQDQVCVN